MESKRARAPRTAINLKAEVRLSMRSYPASARDLSTTGLKLRGAFKPQAGERIAVTLMPPGGLRLSLQAEIRWVREEAPGQSLVGAKFIHASDSRQKLDQLVREAASGRLG